MKYDFDNWSKTEMTQEEALAWFESEFEVTDGKRCSPTCPQCQAEEWAIKALEKQIPKKPIAFNELVGRYPNEMLLDDYEAHKCPSCGRELKYSKERYCHSCGQKLEWGKEKTDETD